MHSVDGDNYVALRRQESGLDSVAQTVSDLQSGTRYRVTFFAAARPGYGQCELTVSVTSGGTELATKSAHFEQWSAMTLDFIPSSDAVDIKFENSSGAGHHT